MQGVMHCQESTEGMKKHRANSEFKVTAVKMASAPDVETNAVAMGARLGPGVSGFITNAPAGRAHIPLEQPSVGL